tara:strand:- start:1163 stop:2233 length:1071 start_codon:yes stop_codon:yes gene_type:complete
MACIIKFPGKTKGVVSFTTQEQKHFSSLDFLKEKWVVGLHHNWQPGCHDPRFDFNFTGKDDMATPNAPLIDMDACNFVSEHFFPTDNDKHWDILYVTRSVQFKRLDAFFKIIRDLYDRGYHYRVLLIVCMCPDMETTSSRIPKYPLQVYQEMFSHDEREKFNFLEMNHNYPFTFDHKTLSVFYKNSKIFLHTANQEFRCRVAAQAHACAMPLVSYPCQSTLLPRHLRKPPVNYISRSDSEIVDNLIKCLSDYENNKNGLELKEVSDYFQDVNTNNRLENYLKDFFKSKGLEFDSDDGFNFKNLDRRMGRHHGISLGSNKVDLSLQEFCNILMSDIEYDSDVEDLEIYLTEKYYDSN